MRKEHLLLVFHDSQLICYLILILFPFFSNHYFTLDPISPFATIQLLLGHYHLHRHKLISFSTFLNLFSAKDYLIKFSSNYFPLLLYHDHKMVYYHHTNLLLKHRPTLGAEEFSYSKDSQFNLHYQET